MEDLLRQCYAPLKQVMHGGIRPLRAKRSANTARDMPPARASWSIVLRRAASTWISRSCGPARNPRDPRATLRSRAADTERKRRASTSSTSMWQSRIGAVRIPPMKPELNAPAPQDRLDLLLQRAPIEAGRLLQ